MTAAELARMLLRRWYLTCLGAAASLVVLAFSLQQPPVYFTQLDVVLMPPPDQDVTNTLQDSSQSLAPLAGLLVQDVNGGRPVAELGSATTTLYGEGVRDGTRVRLRNHGSQWRPIYDVGIVDVQVVAADPGVVRTRADALVTDLDRALAERQAAVGVDPPARVFLDSAPRQPVVQQVGPSRSRAAGSVAILGASLTFVAVVLVDRRLTRKRTDP